MKDNERKKQWRIENKDRINAARRACVPTQEQRELARLRKARWKAANPDRNRAQRAKDKAIEKEKRRIATGFYDKQAHRIERKAEADRLRASRRARQEAWLALPWNDPELSEGESFSLRYRLDICFNLQERVRSAMNKPRHGHAVVYRLRDEPEYLRGRSLRATQALPYTTGELKAHLESLFTEGMSWDIYLRGEIEIDHKTPLEHFDLSDEAQIIEAWALDNLQPLWTADNRDKRCRSMSEWLPTLPASHPLRARYQGHP